MQQKEKKEMKSILWLWLLVLVFPIAIAINDGWDIRTEGCINCTYYYNATIQNGTPSPFTNDSNNVFLADGFPTSMNVSFIKLGTNQQYSYESRNYWGGGLLTTGYDDGWGTGAGWFQMASTGNSYTGFSMYDWDRNYIGSSDRQTNAIWIGGANWGTSANTNDIEIWADDEYMGTNLNTVYMTMRVFPRITNNLPSVWIGSMNFNGNPWNYAQPRYILDVGDDDMRIRGTYKLGFGGDKDSDYTSYINDDGTFLSFITDKLFNFNKQIQMNSNEPLSLMGGNYIRWWDNINNDDYDVNLYRGGDDLLKTDDNFEAPNLCYSDGSNCLNQSQDLTNYALTNQSNLFQANQTVNGSLIVTNATGTELMKVDVVGNNVTIISDSLRQFSVLDSAGHIYLRTGATANTFGYAGPVTINAGNSLLSLLGYTGISFSTTNIVRTTLDTDTWNFKNSSGTIRAYINATSGLIGGLNALFSNSASTATSTISFQNNQAYWRTFSIGLGGSAYSTSALGGLADTAYFSTDARKGMKFGTTLADGSESNYPHISMYVANILSMFSNSTSRLTDFYGGIRIGTAGNSTLIGTPKGIWNSTHFGFNTLTPQTDVEFNASVLIKNLNVTGNITGNLISTNITLSNSTGQPYCIYINASNQLEVLAGSC